MILLEFIQTVLDEGMKQPDDLPEGYKVIITKSQGSALVRIDHPDYVRPLAVVDMHTAFKVADGGECDGAWIVTVTEAKKGWGPLAYDIAMEWATIYGGGLTPDRDTVSSDALSVWEKYMKRSDVRKYRLSKGSCRMKSKKDTKRFMKKSPMDYRFEKQPTQINALKKLGKFVVED